MLRIGLSNQASPNHFFGEHGGSHHLCSVDRLTKVAAEIAPVPGEEMGRLGRDGGNNDRFVLGSDLDSGETLHVGDLGHSADQRLEGLDAGRERFSRGQRVDRFRFSSASVPSSCRHRSHAAPPPGVPAPGFQGNGSGGSPGRQCQRFPCGHEPHRHHGQSRPARSSRRPWCDGPCGACHRVGQASQRECRRALGQHRPFRRPRRDRGLGQAGAGRLQRGLSRSDDVSASQVEGRAVGNRRFPARSRLRR